MSNQVDVVEAEAMKLTPEERARLADRLIASLSDDTAIEEAWAMEVERRIADTRASLADIEETARHAGILPGDLRDLLRRNGLEDYDQRLRH